MTKSLFHIVLVHPVIPQNTGSIARLCACTGATLHLIHPLGFKTDAASVRRAGLDYWEHVMVQEHASWEAFVVKEKPQRMAFLSRFAERSLYDAELKGPIHLIFGSETTGLPSELKSQNRESLYRIPIRTDIVRSLNLAQAVAITLYETMRVSSTLPTN